MFNLKSKDEIMMIPENSRRNVVPLAPRSVVASGSVNSGGVTPMPETVDVTGIDDSWNPSSATLRAQRSIHWLDHERLQITRL